MKLISAKSAKKISHEERIRQEIAEKERLRIQALKEEQRRQKELAEEKERSALAKKLPRIKRGFQKSIFLAALDGEFSVSLSAKYFYYLEDQFIECGFKPIGEIVDETRGFSWDHFKDASLYKNINNPSNGLIRGHKMFWLSSKSGQDFISSVANKISATARSGLDRCQINFKEIKQISLILGTGDELIDVFSPGCSIQIDSFESLFAPIDLNDFIRIFQLLGYKCVVMSEESQEELTIQISW